MTGKSYQAYLSKLTLGLVLTLWIALQIPQMQKFPDIFQGFGTRARPEWTRFIRIGPTRLRGLSHPYRLCRGFMFENKCKGTLVTPYWPSAAYWPLALLVKQFVAFVRTTIIIKGNVALRQGSNSKSLLGSPDWQGNVLVCSLDFSD